MNAFVHECVLIATNCKFPAQLDDCASDLSVLFGSKQPLSLIFISMARLCSLVLCEFSLDSTCDTELAEGFYELLTSGSTASLHHFIVHVAEILLLRAEDGARPRDTDPSDEVSGREAHMLHNIQCY